MPPIAFVSGHLDLTEVEFCLHYIPQIEAACTQGCVYLVGEARGADVMFQHHARDHGLSVTVFHMLGHPRFNPHNFPTQGGFSSDTARDKAMTAASTLDIAWVRPGRERSGTAQNLARRG